MATVRFSFISNVFLLYYFTCQQGKPWWWWKMIYLMGNPYSTSSILISLLIQYVEKHLWYLNQEKKKVCMQHFLFLIYNIFRFHVFLLPERWACFGFVLEFFFPWQGTCSIVDLFNSSLIFFLLSFSLLWIRLCWKLKEWCRCLIVLWIAKKIV